MAFGPTYTPHAEHAHIPARMYHCSHYGHKGHLAKLFYDRLYFLNLACTNPLGSKKGIKIHVNYI